MVVIEVEVEPLPQVVFCALHVVLHELAVRAELPAFPTVAVEVHTTLQSLMVCFEQLDELEVVVVFLVPADDGRLLGEVREGTCSMRHGSLATWYSLKAS